MVGQEWVKFIAVEVTIERRELGQKKTMAVKVFNGVMFMILWTVVHKRVAKPCDFTRERIAKGGSEYCIGEAKRVAKLPTICNCIIILMIIAIFISLTLFRMILDDRLP